MTAAGCTFVVEDVRGYGATVVERLRNALEENCPVQSDPRHPNLFTVDKDGDSFYIAPLPTGKVLLLAYWRS